MKGSWPKSLKSDQIWHHLSWNVRTLPENFLYNSKTKKGYTGLNWFKQVLRTPFYNPSSNYFFSRFWSTRWNLDGQQISWSFKFLNCLIFMYRVFLFPPLYNNKIHFKVFSPILLKNIRWMSFALSNKFNTHTGIFLGPV